MTEERKLSSHNLALVLVHDVLLSSGIQAGDGPLKQAILRHKTRLHSEFQRVKIKRGVKLNEELAQAGDARAGSDRYSYSGLLTNIACSLVRIPRYARVNTTLWTTEEAISSYTSRGFVLSDPFDSKYASDPS